MENQIRIKNTSITLTAGDGPPVECVPHTTDKTRVCIRSTDKVALVNVLKGLGLIPDEVMAGQKRFVAVTTKELFEMHLGAALGGAPMQEKPVAPAAPVTATTASKQSTAKQSKQKPLPKSHQLPAPVKADVVPKYVNPDSVSIPVKKKPKKGNG